MISAGVGPISQQHCPQILLPFVGQGTVVTWAGIKDGTPMSLKGRAESCDFIQPINKGQAMPQHSHNSL